MQIFNVTLKILTYENSGFNNICAEALKYWVKPGSVIWITFADGPSAARGFLQGYHQYR